MSKIRSKDTAIEIRLRKELWSRGLRYRKNCTDLPGKPDVVFKGAKVAVFCDSEFWHGKDYEESASRIGTNREYWSDKIARNIKRDVQVRKELESEGWVVLRFWGKDIQNNLTGCVDLVENFVKMRLADGKQ